MVVCELEQHVLLRIVVNEHDPSTDNGHGARACVIHPEAEKAPVHDAVLDESIEEHTKAAVI
jgi:hypothetical protein